jgi:cytochrome P450
MLLYILFTVAAVLAAWIWFKHPAPKSTTFPALALPPRLTFGEIFSIMKASAGTKNGFFEVVQKKYGDLVWIRVPFWSDIALFTSPEYSKTFFAAKEADFLRGYQIFHKIASPPIFYQTKTYLTDVFAKAFSTERYSYFAKLLKRQIDQYFEEHWNGNNLSVNLFEEVDHLILNGMIRSFLGNDLQGAELDRFVHLVNELDIEDRMKSLKRIMYYSMPWGKKASTIQFNEVIQLVSKAIDNRIKNNSTEPDFFNFLIQELRTPQGGPDYDLISLAIFSIIFAGTTNTYATSAWCLAFISSDPNLKVKVMEEKEQYFAALNKGDDVASLLINGLPFTSRFIYETVRICVGGFAPRYSLQDLNVADKFVIPKDWFLFFPYGLISHNPTIYSAPDSHNPDRFLTEAKEPYQNVSFGAGRHPCTGVKFATMNIKTLIFSFLDRFDAEISENVHDLMPKEQVMGVFRPVKPCMVKLTPKVK